mmetsp:Transcript_7073/g.21575  ORF Transcript_7073/g.21575 Transcript_7073/m.21575 type:complete len:238 (-) Transcript_7073:2682-3395(-)
MAIRLRSRISRRSALSACSSVSARRCCRANSCALALCRRRWLCSSSSALAKAHCTSRVCSTWAFSPSDREASAAPCCEDVPVLRRCLSWCRWVAARVGGPVVVAAAAAERSPAPGVREAEAEERLRSAEPGVRATEEDVLRRAVPGVRAVELEALRLSAVPGVRAVEPDESLRSVVPGVRVAETYDRFRRVVPGVCAAEADDDLLTPTVPDALSVTEKEEEEEEAAVAAEEDTTEAA